MRPLTWALNEVDPVGLHRQSGNKLEAITYIIQTHNKPITVLHRSHDEIVKLDKKRTDRAVITVNIM
jgi:hypothetical protein